MDTSTSATFCGHPLDQEQVRTLLAVHSQYAEQLVCAEGGYRGCRIIDAIKIGDCLLFGIAEEDESEKYFLGLIFEVMSSRWGPGDAGHWIAEDWPNPSLLEDLLRDLGIEPQDTYPPQHSEGCPIELPGRLGPLNEPQPTN